jgi:hypothetical protein
MEANKVFIAIPLIKYQIKSGLINTFLVDTHE